MCFSADCIAISQHWFPWWLGATRQQTIMWKMVTRIHAAIWMIRPILFERDVMSSVCFESFIDTPFTLSLYPARGNSVSNSLMGPICSPAKSDVEIKIVWHHVDTYNISYYNVHVYAMFYLIMVMLLMTCMFYVTITHESCSTGAGIITIFPQWQWNDIEGYVPLLLTRFIFNTGMDK